MSQKREWLKEKWCGEIYEKCNVNVLGVSESKCKGRSGRETYDSWMCGEGERRMSVCVCEGII